MKIIFAFVIFCLVLFIYLHVQFHLKKSNDLEMYEIDQASKEKLEEICDLRQPVLFDFDNEKIVETTNKQYILDNYSAFEIKIRNIREKDLNTELFMPLPMNAAVKLFSEDKTASYYSENNGDFLQETGIVKNMRYNDEFLRPYMVSNCNYDVMFGAANVCTPFRYEINYRNFFLLTQGSAQIKMAPPQSIKYLYPNYDYENFEFKSPVDPWNPQAQYKADFDKIKCLEFTLLPGKTVFIPAFWWYSIKLNKDACISCFRYRTYMNNLAVLPYFGMYALQIQNVKRETVPIFPLLKKVMRSEEQNEEQNQPLGDQNNQEKSIVLENQILKSVINNDAQREEQHKDNDTTPIDLLSPTI
jgi:hypothetical protein